MKYTVISKQHINRMPLNGPGAERMAKKMLEKEGFIVEKIETHRNHPDFICYNPVHNYTFWAEVKNRLTYRSMDAVIRGYEKKQPDQIKKILQLQKKGWGVRLLVFLNGKLHTLMLEE